jgi:hypothetical protein
MHLVLPAEGVLVPGPQGEQVARPGLAATVLAAHRLHLWLVMALREVRAL